MDGDLTPALQRVTASVVEAQRRRQQVEEELASAAAAVASLQQQSASFEASLLELRKELEATLQAKEHEEQALEQVSARRAEALAEIDELAESIRALRGESEQTERSLDSRIKSLRSSVATIEEEVRGLKSQFAKLGTETGSLRDVIGRIRESTETALRQLDEVDSKAKELDGVADGVAARLCGVTDAVDHLQKDQLQVKGAADELHAFTEMLAQHKAKAEAAITTADELTKERARTAAAIEEQLAKINELCPPPVKAAVGATSDVTTAFSNGSSTPVPPAPAYTATRALLELGAAQGLLPQAEAANGEQLLHEGGVDKLVRSWWSRAMASAAPSYYRLVLGQALAEAGDSKGALTFFNRAMEGKQTDPFVTYLVARALLDMKRYVDVLRIAQGLSRTKFGKALASNVEALHLAGSRRYDEAESKLAQALATPGLPKIQYSETLYNLGRTADAKGDVRAAAAWYERLCGVDPHFRDVVNHIERRETPAVAP